MSRVYLFADEAGNFDFNRKPGASKYFLIGTVRVTDLALEQQVLDLRRDLAWRGTPIHSAFHASTDAQVVRDEVFELLQDVDFRYDATILEKCKTKPRLQMSQERFYKTAWYLHLKYIGPAIASAQDELFVIAASILTRKRRAAVRSGIADVVSQSTMSSKWEVGFWPAESDPCLQVADYCTWAVQRKLELNDLRSYSLIARKIRTEFRPFDVGPVTYY